MQTPEGARNVRSLGPLDGARLVYRAINPYGGRAIASLLFTALGIGFEAVALVSLVPLFELLTDDSAVSVSRDGVFGLLDSVLGAVGLEYTIGTLMGIVAGLFLLKALVTIAGEIGRTSVYTDFERDIRDELSTDLLASRWAYVRDRRAGVLLNILTQQASRSGTAVSQSLKLMSELATVAVYTAFAMLISPLATVMLLAILGGTGALTRYVFRSLTVFAGYSVEYNARLMQRLSEMISGFKIIKAMAVENIIAARIRSDTDAIKRMGMRAGVVRAIFASTLEPGIVIALGAVLLLRALGIASIGEAGVIGLLLFRAFQRIYGAAISLAGVADALPSLEAVTNVKQETTAGVESTGSLEPPVFQALRLQNVSFQYEPGRTVLSNVSLDVVRGEFVGIVGASGAGKSTFVDLLLGLVAPTSGTVMVNDMPLSDIRRRDWRRRVGYVPQEIVLFNDTVLSNVSLGRAGLTRDDAVWAIQIAQASQFIESLPEGLGSQVGERGVKLSGGERQRLALARAIAAKPEILILDEATSSLDSVAEREFQEALHHLRNRFTIIAVAHRLSTVLDADRIVVFDGGRVVELGRPDELLAQDGGAFRRLYDVQVGSPRSPVTAGG